MGAPTMRNLAVKELIRAEQISSTETGTGVDLQPYTNPGGREMKAVLSTTAVSGTTPTMDVKIQESAVLGSGYTDITGATFTQVTDSSTTEEIHFQTNLQFVRAIATLAGTSPVYDAAVVLVVRKKLT